MLEKHNKRGRIHLVNLIGRRSNETPNFALLIGAGSSVSSGIRPTCQMIADWRSQLYEQAKTKKPFNKWLREQDWYEYEEEYSILFERVYDQRSQRRIYVEEWVKNAKPSWGYVYLANIIAHNYFNVIFTPNFDDLLNEACFLYADLRPIVCAHDSAVADVRLTSARAKIIKLHGDFLYDSIKNTVRETETLEKNMRDKFTQFAREYGLVVIGYGGNDRSIMDILDTLLKSEGYFPNGLYWCVRKDGRVSKKLQRLMRRENAYWVEIEGFDEFVADLHESLGLTLPDTVRDPYKATTERLNRFILPKGVKHPVIKRAIAELHKQVKDFEQIISGKATTEDLNRLVPYRFLGDKEFLRSEFDKALSYYEKARVQNRSDLDLLEMIFDSYFYSGKPKKALGISKEIIKQAPTNYRGYYLEGITLVSLYPNKLNGAIRSLNKALKYTAKSSTERSTVLISRSNAYLVAGRWKDAFSDAEKALHIEPKESSAVINKCHAMKKMGKGSEAAKILKDLLPEIEYKYDRACAFAILGDKKNMLKELKRAITKHRGYRTKARIHPEFADYREDSDFRKLVYD